MATKKEQEREYQRMIRSLHEYSTVDDIIEDDINRPAILKLLYTHRPVKRNDYEYGLSYSLKNEYRLIVKEAEDRSKVREYGRNSGKNSWLCSKYSARRFSCRARTVRFKYGIVFAPRNHGSMCYARDYSDVMQIQDLLKRGKPIEANALANRLYRPLRKNASQPLSALENDGTTLSANDGANESNLEEYESDYSNHHPRSASPTFLTSPETSPESSSRSRVKRALDENDNYDILEVPAIKMPRIQSNDHKVYSFCRPCDSVLKELCKKLDVEYSNEAYKFWGDVVFTKIVPFSRHVKPYNFESRNFYACLSLFFTGKMVKFSKIQGAIHNAFRRELITSSTKSPDEIIDLFTSPTATDEHIDFLAKFLPCRIGIYQNGELKKYGEWETCKRNALTLIFCLADEKYSVVLDL